MDSSGHCDYGYACVYSDTISWASPTQPLPMTIDPRQAFERLFGDGSTPEERALRQQANGSILDRIAHRVSMLQRDLGAERPQPAQRISGRCSRNRAAHREDREHNRERAMHGRCRRRRWACRIPLKST